MQVKEIMTPDPACCTPDTSLSEVAKMMLNCDCGEIPVVKNQSDKEPVGVVTDRDIVCRILAQDKNPLEMQAKDCMSSPCVTIGMENDVEEGIELMERHKIRRVLVVDDNGKCCGIVAQADIANACPPEKTAEVVHEISVPASA